MKKLLALMMILVLALSLAACGKKEEEDVTPEPEPVAEKKILRIAESFAYASLDAHKDYNGWYTSIYGMTETLFKIGNDLSVQPLLEEWRCGHLK